MKRWTAGLAIVAALLSGAAATEREVVLNDFSLNGEIDGENIVFDLSFEVDARRRNMEIPLVTGDVAYLGGKWPGKAKLKRDGKRYLLAMGSARRGRISFRFASRPVKAGDWRSTSFVIPASNIRKLAMICDRDDLEVRFPHALAVERRITREGKAEVTAFLGIADEFQVRWKPEVKKLDAELVVSCEANTIATAGVGAMKLDTVFTYRVIQGALKRLTLDLPEINVTRVEGEDIQDWRIDRIDKDRPKLIVQLSRPREGTYRLGVESDVMLPRFPCHTVLPVLTPRDAIRTSGFLLIGADSAIKLQMSKVAGLTQVDQASFPSVNLAHGCKTRQRPKPTRSVFAYQYAGAPYVLEIDADDIVTAFTADNRLSLRLSDNELALDASIEIDIKDAPAREIRIETDADDEWTVTSITGNHVSEADTDVRDENGKRVIYVPFKQAVRGSALINLRMEKSLNADASAFEAPTFRIIGAKSERGYLVLAAEKGTRLKATSVEGLREVHTGSAPMRVSGAQQAFRFRQPGWKLSMAVERTKSSIHSEVFHLVSLGEGVMYCSAAITYHISGAPVQEFSVRVPETIKTIEFAGADIEGWRREGKTCIVRLQTRVLGDYTLLATYDEQFDYEGAVVSVGGIETVGAESEVGYVAIASSASLRLTEHEDFPGAIIEIDQDELPKAYSSAVNDPVIKSYKYARTPHAVPVRVEPLDTERLLGQIADYVKLSTKVNRKGGIITTSTYYIKNASRQHLVLSMPPSAKLWTIKYVHEDGRKEDAPSQEKGNEILIPVRRPRDPNTAIAVELVYAESLDDLGFWNSGVRNLKLAAPSLRETHATFASWRVTAPESFAIAASGGNMIARNDSAKGGIFAAGEKFLRLIKTALRGECAFTRALAGSGENSSEKVFSRAVNLASGSPLTLRLSIVPRWMGGGASARAMLAGVSLGVLLLVAGLLVHRRFIITAGLTSFVWGTAQAEVGRSILAAGLALALTGLLAWFLFRHGFRLLWRLFRVVVPKAWFVFRSCPAAAMTFAARMLAWLRDRLVAGWHAFQRGRERRYERKLRLRAAVQPAGTISPFELPDPMSPDSLQPDGEAGFVAVRWLGLLAMTAVGGMLAFTCLAGEPAEPVAPIMDSIRVRLVGPGTRRDDERSASMNMTLSFRAEKPTSLPVLPSRCVLTSFDLNSKWLSVDNTDEGFILRVAKRGSYKASLECRIPVEKADGRWTVGIPLLENMRNEVKFELPEPGLEIKADKAVLFRTSENGSETTAEAVFGPTRHVEFTWRPRIRKTTLEEVVFFSEINTFVELQAGVVDMLHLVKYQIAQGETKELRLLAPEGMSVTAVASPEIATWSFEPEKRILDVILKKPVTGAFSLKVSTQVACDGLPYAATLGALRIVDATRQRGAIAIAAPDTVQVRVDDTETANPMNIEDFSRSAVDAACSGSKKRKSMNIRRAFRYHKPELVMVKVHAERVLPEIRVNEISGLDISDERIVLTTKLALAVAKSGVFRVRLDVPADFDVETLSGRDVSHWDEIAEEGTAGKTNSRSVLVHFTWQVTESTELDLVVARTEKGIEKTVLVPKVSVRDARKHTGRLTISGERGVRMMVANHRGVDIRKASEVGIMRPGVLVFDILRPTWSIALKTEVMSALIKPDVLQWVDLTEGMLQCRAYLRYQIENAGVKTFQIRSPMPGITLSVTGRNIARVHEVDEESGLWQIDLHGKVENQFAMTVNYQAPFDHEGRKVNILPLQTVKTDGQRGWLVVTCGGRVQVVPPEAPTGLKMEDPRNIPMHFGAGDLSNAILCYRMLNSECELPLSVVRHESASVLPASIRKVRMTSIVSNSRKTLTRVLLELTAGDLRLLKARFPNKDDQLWSVLVNGKEVTTSRDRRFYCIPLEEQEVGEKTSVEMIYAGSARGGGHFSRQKHVAPAFEGLPLNDVKWSFFVLPNAQYHAFGGTMENDPIHSRIARVFDANEYQEWNRLQREENLKMARDVLVRGEQMARSGHQKRAKKAFQQACNYSLGQADLNEDARVMLRNLTKQQFKMGLVDRRAAVRFRNNIIDEVEAQRAGSFENGDYTQEYVMSVEQGLSPKENDALEVVADKMIDQQAAAAGVVTAIRITVPEHGRELRFSRALLEDPDEELSVTFRSSSGELTRLLNTLWPAALLFAVMWALTAHTARPSPCQVKSPTTNPTRDHDSSKRR